MEAFCAEHNVSSEEVLYDWPSSRFEAFYAAFTKRKIADELAERKRLEMAALWSNPNLDNDDQPQARSNALTQLEENYDQAITLLYTPASERKLVEIDEDDPFWKAAKRGMEKHKLPSGIDQIDDE